MISLAKRAFPAAVLLCSCAAIRPAPLDGASLLARAQADLAAGRDEDAAREFEELLERDPRSLPALRGRIEAAGRRGDLARVASEAAAAAQARPADGSALYALGLARFAEGDAAAAETALARAVELMPAEADVPYRLGLLLLERRNLPEARERLRRSVELGPAVARYRIALAVCLGRLGDREGALHALREIPALQPSAEEAVLAVRAGRDLADPFRDAPGEVRRDLENALGYLSGDAPGLALEILEAAVVRFPDLAIAHALLALAAERLEEPARAVGELKQAAELAPHLPQPRLWLGELYESTDRFEMAAQEYAAALEAAPLEPATLRRLGTLRLERLGQTAAALPPLRDAAALDPGDAALQILVARAELASGAAPGGLARLDRLVSGHSGEADVLVGVAGVFFERAASAGQAERGQLTRRVVALCEKALELRPRSPAATRLLAQAQASSAGRHD
jgi:tetratricopeptide (TPR) repeat protein